MLARMPRLYLAHVLIPSLSVSLGVLLEGDRDAKWFRRRLEQSGVRVQCTGWNLAGDSSLWEGGWSGSQFSRRLHQSWQRSQGGADFWSVCIDVFVIITITPHLRVLLVSYSEDDSKCRHSRFTSVASCRTLLVHVWCFLQLQSIVQWS